MDPLRVKMAAFMRDVGAEGLIGIRGPNRLFEVTRESLVAAPTTRLLADRDLILSMIGVASNPQTPLSSETGFPVPKNHIPEYTVVSTYGVRGRTGANGVRRLGPHDGIDIAGKREGSPLVAGLDGVVRQLGSQSGYGNILAIESANRFNSQVIWLFYAHLSGYAPGISVGAKVTQGQVVAYIGKTGLSTGVHLHYEVRLGANSKHNSHNPLDVFPGIRQKMQVIGVGVIEKLNRAAIDAHLGGKDYDDGGHD